MPYEHLAAQLMPYLNISFSLCPETKVLSQGKAFDGATPVRRAADKSRLQTEIAACPQNHF